MAGNVDPTDIEDEEDIVWLEDPAGHEYVRELLETSANFRRRRPAWRHAGRLVGYATLKPDVRAPEHPGYFWRRMFWIAEHDRSEQPDHYPTGTPGEGVDPLTVSPGVPGRQTQRSWGCRNVPPGTPHHAGNQCSVCGQKWQRRPPPTSAGAGAAPAAPARPDNTTHHSGRYD